MPKVKSTRINGRRVKLHLEPIDGYSIDYADGKGEIYVDPRNEPERAFRALVHELIHKRFPSLTERQVLKIERDICTPAIRLFDIKKKDGAW